MYTKEIRMHPDEQTPPPGLMPRVNIWIERDGSVAMSLWRVALLEAVAATGSISSAADEMDVSYRVAWNKIRQMELALGEPLVETRVGGTDGGGATLTPTAEAYVVRFRYLRQRLEDWVEQQFKVVFGAPF